MRMQRLALLMAVMGLALSLVAGQALGADDFYVVGTGGTGRVLKTQVFTSTSSDGTVGTGTWAKLAAPQWTYTKLRSTSYLVITYQDYLGAEGADMSRSMYQLRVNDQPSGAGANAAVLSCGGNLGGSFGATGVWSGVAQGSATLSIWHRQEGCTLCGQNNLFYTTTVIVMEIEQ